MKLVAKALGETRNCLEVYLALPLGELAPKVTERASAASAVASYDPTCEKGVQESPRLRSNESPSGAFKRQSGLRKQMEGPCPDKLRRLF